MKLLTDSEFENLKVKGRGGSTQVYDAILNLKAGEKLMIEKADWKKRYSPSRTASYIGKRNNRKFKTWMIIDGTGWVVKRIS